jgi:hypothetical protein
MRPAPCSSSTAEPPPFDDSPAVTPQAFVALGLRAGMDGEPCVSGERDPCRSKVGHRVPERLLSARSTPRYGIAGVGPSTRAGRG